MTYAPCRLCYGEQWMDDEDTDGGSVLVLCPRCKGSGEET
jgi:hypothetical protein